jgi:hypothetical protein
MFEEALIAMMATKRAFEAKREMNGFDKAPYLRRIYPIAAALWTNSSSHYG